MMNRGISTPLDVAEKISLRKAQSAVLAIVRPKEESLAEGDDFLFSEEYRETPVAVDINQPLEYSCNLGKGFLQIHCKIFKIFCVSKMLRVRNLTFTTKLAKHTGEHAHFSLATL